MTILKMNNLDSAPAASRPLLHRSIDGFGWIPWQSACMAESPVLLFNSIAHTQIEPQFRSLPTQQ